MVTGKIAAIVLSMMSYIACISSILNKTDVAVGPNVRPRVLLLIDPCAYRLSRGCSDPFPQFAFWAAKGKC
jgi:hypothetical protein